MTRLDDTHRGGRGGAGAAVIAGFAQGTLLFGMLLAAEFFALGRDVRSTLGSPIAVIATLYLLTGAGLGVVLGLGAWFLARVVPCRPARLCFALLLCTCGVLFALRSAPSHFLATFPPKLIVVMVAAVAVMFIGFWWSRRSAAVSSPRVRSARVAAAVLAAAACALSSGWVFLYYQRLPQHRSAPADAPNVVFVLIDALRHDRLSCFGYARPTSPFIDRLASHGVAFDNAYSHGSRTIISVPSLFTSIYPSYTRENISGEWLTPLPDSQTTLAEMFQQRGYSTYAMMSNPYLKRPFGLTQGFDRVEEFNDERFTLSLYRVLLAVRVMRKPYYAVRFSPTAEEVTNTAVQWLGRARKETPFFCYVHYMDVHHPYLPPRAYEDMFNSRDWLSSIDAASLYAKTVELIKEGKPYPLSDDELVRLSDLYDACIRYVDAEIARLVSTAQAANTRPTIVVITSDHGDEFQEHGGLYHNNVVIEELIRVPLVIWRSDDSGEGRRVTQMVRHIDVLPTLAEWIGAQPPARAVGRSLLPLMNGQSDAGSTVSVAEGRFCSALVEPQWKVMRVDTANADSLYNLGDDPGATRNVAALYPEQFQRMRDALDAYYQGVPAADSTARSKLDDATIKQLRALGYMN